MAKITATELLDMGDLAAPPGSPRWCIAVREEARSALLSAKATKEHVLRWVHALQEADRFRRLADAKGNRFLTWEAFCEAEPPYGFGMTADEVQSLIDSKPAQALAADPEVKPLNSNGGDRKTEEGKSALYNNTDYGTSSSYLVRRLKRDAPEIAEALARGEYKSARAAGIAAGIVRVPTDYELAQKVVRKLTPKDRQRLVRWMDDGMP